MIEGLAEKGEQLFSDIRVLLLPEPDAGAD